MVGRYFATNLFSQYLAQMIKGWYLMYDKLSLRTKLKVIIDIDHRQYDQGMIFNVWQAIIENQAHSDYWHWSLTISWWERYSLWSSLIIGNMIKIENLFMMQDLPTPSAPAITMRTRSGWNGTIIRLISSRADKSQEIFQSHNDLNVKSPWPLGPQWAV